MVSKHYPEYFEDLNRFCVEYIQFDNSFLSQFARELQFYLSWLDYIAPLRELNLPFCYPGMTDQADHLSCYEAFDLHMATNELDKTVVNDFVLDSPERIIVLTGSSQGGKTTFARAFGQIHYMAALGLCVPGREATLYLFDQIFTHFGQEEDIANMSGKLQDDLVRLHSLLAKATKRSIVVINEIFASTTLNDALQLGSLMMDAFVSLGAPTILVTFLDELAAHSPETVSMMCMVKEDDPAQRTFQILRRSPDGLAYAMHIAGKHGLTYEQLNRRLAG